MIDDIQIAWMIANDMVYHTLYQHVACRVVRVTNPIDTVLGKYIKLVLNVV